MITQPGDVTLVAPLSVQGDANYAVRAESVQGGFVALPSGSGPPTTTNLPAVMRRVGTLAFTPADSKLWQLLGGTADINWAPCSFGLGPDFGALDLKTTGSLSLGTNPAAAGALRLANGSSINARAASNTSDFTLLSFDSSNVLVVGDAANTTTRILGSAIICNPANVATVAITAGLFEITTAGAAEFRFRVQCTTPLIDQGINVNVVTCQTLTVRAQGSSGNGSVGGKLALQGGVASGTSGTGGDVEITPGTGVTSNGVFRVLANTTTVLSLGNVSGDYLSLGVAPASTGQVRLPYTTNTIVSRNSNNTADFAVYATGGTSGNQEEQVFGAINNAYTTLQGAGGIQFKGAGPALLGSISTANGLLLQVNIQISSAVAPVIKQQDSPAIGGVGGLFTIIAQSGTGTGSTGGSLLLRGGIGLSAGGNVAIGLAPAAWQSLDRGVFLAEGVTIPSGNPANGAFLYQDPADHKVKIRGQSGTVTVLALP